MRMGIAPVDPVTGGGPYQAQHSATLPDLSRWTAEDIAAVESALNSRPRKALGWRTPAEALDELQRSSQQTSVATTG